MTLLIRALMNLRPGAEYVLRGDMLEWLDQRQTQPTDAEIQAELDRLIAEQPLRNAQQQRAAAYVSEADPLFFKAQRGEATMDDWNAKVAEIRARFPYPTEAN
jgi:lysophospholipase L1-like esterase